MTSRIEKPLLPDQVWKVFHLNCLARANKNADIAIPTIILVFHIREARTAEMKDIHRAHVDTGPATVAPALVHLDPRIGLVLWNIRADKIHLSFLSRHKTSGSVCSLFFDMALHPGVSFRVFPIRPFLKGFADIKGKFGV
jgi:hypothetical protein